MPVPEKNSELTVIGHTFNKLLQQVGDPVDFELPKWLNDWKPTPYKFIKRNLYMTKIKKRIEDDGIFCSCSPANGSSSVCGRDCHCGMLLSSCSANCKCGGSCINKPFQLRPVKKMKLVKTEKCGEGVVADEDIKRGEFVIEYVGEVIDDKTCEERLWKMKHRGEKNFYLCEVNRDMVIDATYKGNKSRYINHSCCPNTEMQKWQFDGETRIGIFASRDIKKGDHLTYDYQFVQFGADQDCFCNASRCRQILGAKVGKPKISSDATLKSNPCRGGVSSPRWKTSSEYVKVRNGGRRADKGNRQHVSKKQRTECHNCIGEFIMIKRSSSERYFGMIKRFDGFSRKHTVMFEDGMHEIVDLTELVWEFY